MTAKERAKLMCDQFETQDLPDGTSIVTFANQLATEAIEAAILEERERCQKSVALFAELCTLDLDSDRAEAIRDEHEILANGYRINDNPLHEPIGLAYRKIKKERDEAVRKECEANIGIIRRYLQFNDQRAVSWHEVNDAVEVIQKRGQP